MVFPPGITNKALLVLSWLFLAHSIVSLAICIFQRVNAQANQAISWLLDIKFKLAYMAWIKKNLNPLTGCKNPFGKLEPVYVSGVCMSVAYYPIITLLYITNSQYNVNAYQG